MKRMKPFRKLRMAATVRNRHGERADHGKARLQMTVIREVETQGYRASQDGAVYYVEPHGQAVPIDQQMLVDSTAQHADRSDGCVEYTLTGGRDGSNLDGGAAVLRVLRESAAPSPR